MGIHISKDGRQITIEKNNDGSYSVNDNEGRNRTYGANVADNIYQDWNLRGEDLSDSGVPEEEGGGGVGSK